MLDKIFGSWWPWGQKDTAAATTTAPTTISIPTTTKINIQFQNFTSNLSTEQTILDKLLATTPSTRNKSSYEHAHHSSAPDIAPITRTPSAAAAAASTSSTYSSSLFTSVADYLYDELNLTTMASSHTTTTTYTNYTTVDILFQNFTRNITATSSVVGRASSGVVGGGGDTADDLQYGFWNCSISDVNCINTLIYDPGLVNESTLIIGGASVVGNYSNVTTMSSGGVSGSTGGNNEMETTLHLISLVSTAVVLAIIILATVIGNVFVIAAILLERNLQSVANYLILSLAVADLLVACLVMPLSAVYEVSQEWRLGPELCDMWTSSDVLCCTASILHLVCIALDRYWAVTNIDYVHQRTARRIGLMILFVWALSFLVSIAPMLGWKDPKWEYRLDNLECIVSQDLGYQIFATVSSFYFPLLVILVLYWRIYQTARKRIRRRQQVTQTHPEPLAKASCLALTPLGFRWKVSGVQQPQAGMIATAAGGSGGIAAAVVAVIGRPLPTISETTTAFTNISSTNTSPEKGSLGNGVDRIVNDPPTAELSVAYPAHVSSIQRPPKLVRKKTQQSAESKRERKAAKTLAIITGAFVFCWLPFFIVAILLPTCSSCDISPVFMSFFLWLGYFNSTLNPIIYTIFSPEFRHAFKRILCGRRNSIRRRTRHMVKRGDTNKRVSVSLSAAHTKEIIDRDFGTQHSNVHGFIVGFRFYI